MNFGDFYKKYSITLTGQQIIAAQAINGPYLILAVPGSGKTTVLTYRLGYLVLGLGIKPENLLAITFTTAACNEMKKRFKRLFSSDLGDRIEIRTINSLGLKILQNKTRYSVKTADEEITRELLSVILKKHEIAPYIDTVKKYENAISCIKSRLDQKSMFSSVIRNKNLDESFISIFNEYNRVLKENNMVDFNDQNIDALKYLQLNPHIVREYADKYKYICVDEAQDTNQVQYELIKILSGKNPNVFMVGDEDQSIYGFNGAFPDSLLRFDKDYKNANILMLEQNFRSTPEIVSKAKKFIDENRNRKQKRMYSIREKGDEVVKINVKDMSEQVSYLVSNLTNANADTAVLYRENVTGLVIAYHLNKHGIPFYFIKEKIDGFTASSYKKVLSFLKIVDNPKDYESFEDIYPAIHKNIYEKAYLHVCDEIENNRSDNVLKCLKKYVDGKPFRDNENVKFSIRKALKIMDDAKQSSINEAIKMISAFVIKDEFQASKVSDIFNSIANPEDTISEFLNKIKEIELLVKAKNEESTREGIILSSIHSAKGLEFDTVYLADIYDKVCPRYLSNDDHELYEEERRILYVGMTRAKNKLIFINRNDKSSEFINELFNGVLKPRVFRVSR